MGSQTPDQLIVVTVGSDSVALTRAELDAARARARELGLGVASGGAEVEGLVDSARLSAITGLPQSWLEEAARQSRIPSVVAGKYRRFQPSRVIAALTSDEERGSATRNTAPRARRNAV